MNLVIITSVLGPHMKQKQVCVVEITLLQVKKMIQGIMQKHWSVRKLQALN